MYILAASTWWEKLEEWDRWLFIKLNSQWTNSLFDAVLPIFRDAMFWAPLYLFILVFMPLNFQKKGFWWSLGFICTVALTDLLGARVFKEGFERLRPCADPEFSGHVRLLLEHCSGSFSFVSNHAANHFSLAAFAFFTCRGFLKNWAWIGFLWALSISYAQVYVGVHYPADVLGGALLGMGTGRLIAMVYNRKIGAFASGSLDH